MGQKGRTTVYVDREKVDRIKQELNVDLSTLVSQTLDIVDGSIFDDVAVGIRLRMNDKVIEDTKREVEDVEHKLRILKARLQDAEGRGTRIKEEYKKAQYEVLQTRLMYQLNCQIIAAQFDLPTVHQACGEIVAQMVVHNPMFNLDAHVEALKREMRRS